MRCLGSSGLVLGEGGPSPSHAASFNIRTYMICSPAFTYHQDSVLYFWIQRLLNTARNTGSVMRTGHAQTQLGAGGHAPLRLSQSHLKATAAVIQTNLIWDWQPVRPPKLCGLDHGVVMYLLSCVQSTEELISYTPSHRKVALSCSL